MTKPYPDWRELFTPLLPANLTKDAATFNTSWRAKPFVGAGPFIFDSINQEQGVITWKRNSKWWGAKPLLDSIAYRILPAQVQYAAIMNDEIQFMEFGSDVSSIKLARKNPNLTINSVPGVDKWEHIELNSKSPILSDLLVRRAITVGINREAISEINTGLLVSTSATKNNRIFHAGQECYKDNSGKWSKQSIVLADQLLDDAGWAVATDAQEKDSNGKNKILGMRYYKGPAKAGLVAEQPLTLKFTYPSGNAARENIALLVQSMLRAKPIGIDIQLREVPQQDFFTKFVNPTALDFELTSFSWSSSILPISGALPLYAKNSSQNFAKDSITPALDALIKKTSTEIDPVKRCALANKVDSALWENAFNIPLYVWPGTSAVVKGLANFGSFGWSSIDWTKIGFMK
jgi:peptide/nickel transport system substrate-binding protein